MIRKKIRITLKTDVVITANSATQGEHKTLDYIPGSLLRGYAIANIGGDFKPELFFSGKVRFHNAYPIANNGDFTTPIPNSFHRLKITNANGNDTPIIYNGALQMPAEQTEQMRNNYLAQNQIVVVNKTYHMKTAIDRESRTSMESQLFGYEAISSGSIFGGFIDFDDEIANEDVEAITNALTTKEIRIGKSRSAEYGLAQVENLGNMNHDYNQHQPNAKKTILFLASDLCLEENGIYATKLKASHFGFDNNVNIDWEHSFIRTRKYSPWNAFWNRRMRERQVITKGSVITLEGPIDSNELKNEFKKGFGLYREEGLGQILVNPDFLSTERLQLVSQCRIITSQPIDGIPESSPSDANMISLLHRKCGDTINSQRSRTYSNNWVNTIYQNWYLRYPGKCPTSSQWGNIRNICCDYSRQNTNLLQILNDTCTNGFDNQKWTSLDTQCVIEGKNFTLIGYLKHVIEEIIGRQGNVENISNNEAEEVAAKALFFTAKEISKRINNIGSNNQ